MPVTDKERGWYRKYLVMKINNPTGKHNDCEFFVLDLDHDPHAIPALRAYADSCEEEYPLLADDIRKKIP